MKLYIISWNGSYSSGLHVIAAETTKEAIKIVMKHNYWPERATNLLVEEVGRVIVEGESRTIAECSYAE